MANSCSWQIGQIVEVQPRTWAGINRPGGHGRVIKIHLKDGVEVTESGVEHPSPSVAGFDVKYTMGGFDTDLEPDLVKPYKELDRAGRKRRTREFLVPAPPQPVAAGGNKKTTKNGAKQNKSNKAEEDKENEAKNNDKKTNTAQTKGTQKRKQHKKGDEKFDVNKLAQKKVPKAADARKRTKPPKQIAADGCRKRRKVQPSKDKKARDTSSIPQVIQPVYVEVSPLTPGHFVETSKAAAKSSLPPLLDESGPIDPTSKKQLFAKTSESSAVSFDTPAAAKLPHVVSSSRDNNTDRTKCDGAVLVDPGKLSLRDVYDKNFRDASAFVSDVVGGTKFKSKVTRRLEQLKKESPGEIERRRVFISAFADVMKDNCGGMQESAVHAQINDELAKQGNNAISFTVKEVEQYIEELCDMDKVFRNTGSIYSIATDKEALLREPEEKDPAEIQAIADEILKEKKAKAARKREIQKEDADATKRRKVFLSAFAEVLLNNDDTIEESEVGPQVDAESAKQGNQVKSFTTKEVERFIDDLCDDNKVFRNSGRIYNICN